MGRKRASTRSSACVSTSRHPRAKPPAQPHCNVPNSGRLEPRGGAARTLPDTDQGLNIRFGDARTMKTAPPVTMAMPRPCPICGGVRLNRLLVGTDHREGLGGTFAIFCCQVCGHGITDPIPADIAAWYPSAYAPHARNDDPVQRLSMAALRRTAQGKRASGVVERLLSSATLGGPVPKGATVLDIGAGSGGAVQALRVAGIDAHGIEPGASAVAAAHQAGLTTVQHGTLETVTLPMDAWDVVRLHHVLEYLEDPIATLERIAGLLNPSGRLVISVPNLGGLGRRMFGASWDGLELPRHLHHFTRHSLERAVGDVGLRVEMSWTACVFGIFAGSLDARVHGGQRQSGLGQSLALKAVVFPLELAAATVGMGDALVLVARRP